MRPTVERVVEAVESLRDAHVNRGALAVVQWLFLKSLGLEPGAKPVSFSAGDVRAFCDIYFAVPGQEPFLWFDPLESGWLRDSGSGWPVGTVWTQLKRPNAKLRGLASVVSHGTEMSAVVGDKDYRAGLSKLVKTPLPLLDLAVWRYRFGVPLGVTDADGLEFALRQELSLSDSEVDLVFMEPLSRDLALEPGWPDDALGVALPSPEITGQGPALPEPPPSDPVEVTSDDYRELDAYARLPLNSGDVEELVSRVETEVADRGLLLPDDEVLEQCVLALLTGHLVLQGPPGTGKTTLARALARAFDCSSDMQTATADWSTYDVVGGLQPAVGEHGQEVLRPWLGHVPRAALNCLERVRDHQGDPDGHTEQAHWLVIDEFNRAQIDKAIGSLYTVLGGSGEQFLDLWFETAPERRALAVPQRFRILATMNDVDAGYINDLSQGLSRRFQFVYVGVPRQEQVQTELDTALAQAAGWLVEQYPDRAATSDDANLLDQWRARETVAAVLALLGDVVSELRYPDNDRAYGGWPLGTASLVDVLRTVALRIDTDPLVPVLDSALADRVVPQMNALRPVTLEDFDTWLRARPEHQALPRTRRALLHLQDTSATL